GSRLRPLTDKKPKALMPIANVPIIGRVIEYVKNQGVTEIVVNAHHHQKQMVDYLNTRGPFGVTIEVRVETEILGTGGGIKNTSDFWNADPFIVINSDILTDIDLRPAYERHRKSESLATLILHDYKPFNQIKIDNNNNLVDIAPKQGPGRFAFTGIHLLRPEILSYIPDTGFSDIIDCYRKLIQSKKPPKAYLSEGHTWRDIGTVSHYVQANRDLLKEGRYVIGTDCLIEPSARLCDWAVIGQGSRIEEDAEITRSILWQGVHIRKGLRVIDSIVTAFAKVERDLQGEIC
ncbi:MAG: NDP-sugar synthase, partial [Pseudomonadota bacterium]